MRVKWTLTYSFGCINNRCALLLKHNWQCTLTKNNVPTVLSQLFLHMSMCVGVIKVCEPWESSALYTGYVLILNIVWPSQRGAITLHGFERRWIFHCINPPDQVGFVKVLNFNTLGHLSLQKNRGSVSDQTSYFLIALSEWSGAAEGRSWSQLNQTLMCSGYENLHLSGEVLHHTRYIQYLFVNARTLFS